MRDPPFCKIFRKNNILKTILNGTKLDYQIVIIKTKLRHNDMFSYQKSLFGPNIFNFKAAMRIRTASANHHNLIYLDLLQLLLLFLKTTTRLQQINTKTLSGKW